MQHVEGGHGVVMSVERDRLTVLFDQVGYKTLSLRAVQEQGLVTLDEASEPMSSGTRKGEHDIT